MVSVATTLDLDVEEYFELERGERPGVLLMLSYLSRNVFPQLWLLECRLLGRKRSIAPPHGGRSRSALLGRRIPSPALDADPRNAADKILRFGLTARCTSEACHIESVI